MGIGVPHASIAFVSTYPPTVCGLASFTAALLDTVAVHRRSRRGLGVVGLGDSRSAPSPDVVYHHRRGDRASLERAIRVLNTYDAVSIQHEFGIFSGPDGEEVIDLVAGLEVPTAVTFHTVLDGPTPRQRMIIEHLAGHADRVVVMSETAADRLARRYRVDPARVEVIPHGVDSMSAGPSLANGGRPLVLTWGLIGPDKGLEWVVEAFAGLVDLRPQPRYLIAGATHPNVVEASGESYREGLAALANGLGLDDVIEFDDRYLDRASLARMVRSADLVVLPYTSVEQVTSGVLVEALAASKPVIATRFPHAVELLSGGAGITVPYGDPRALGAGLRRLLTDRRLAARTGRDARDMAHGWFWPTIGERFGSMMSRLAVPGPSLRRQAAKDVTRVAG